MKKSSAEFRFFDFEPRRLTASRPEPEIASCLAPVRRSGFSRTGRISDRVSSPESLTAAESWLRRFIDDCRPGQGKLARLLFTKNSCTMISKSERGGRIALRMHEIFQSAPRELLRDLVEYFFKGRSRRRQHEVRRRLMDYIAMHRDETLYPFPQHRLLPPRGKVYNLIALEERVRRLHLPELEPAPRLPAIAWTRRFHRALMGKWIQNPAPLPNLIIVNRLLDHPEVPEIYVEFIVFHELLHELLPTFRRCGRWVLHPPEFREREKQFPGYREARAWEKNCLGRMTRARHAQ